MIYTKIGYILEKTDECEIEDGIIVLEDIRKRFNELYPAPKEDPEITKLKEELNYQKELLNTSTLIVQKQVKEIERLKKELKKSEEQKIIIEV